ncbi:hypothetical protein ACQPXM_06600 [Kribbella sp. CA-253562]|uniref:hypothetical protein n=1 Tax=Kribbella sp. CA-253562 TaxID=3239942 RepID=UPI003D8C1AF6
MTDSLPEDSLSWSPLSRRRTGLPSEDSVEGMPEWLYPQVAEWLYQVLQYTGGPVSALRPGHGLSPQTRQVMLRIRTGNQPWLLKPEDPLFLDAVDAAIRWIDWGEWPSYRNEYGDPSTLEAVLEAANSAWRATWQGLERRQDPTVTAAVMDAVVGAGAEAGEHLAAAWTAAYGRQPDPDKAYDEAVLAVEALACPLVCPDNSRRTLETVVRDLRNQSNQWELLIGDASGRPAVPDRLAGMLALLWEGQSRHAGSPNSRRQTPSEGEAAVHLAATLVQWFSGGVLRRKK